MKETPWETAAKRLRVLRQLSRVRRAASFAGRVASLLWIALLAVDLIGAGRMLLKR